MSRKNNVRIIPCPTWHRLSEVVMVKEVSSQMHLEKDLKGDRDLTMAKKKHLGILRSFQTMESKVLRGWKRRRHRLRTSWYWVWNTERESRYTVHSLEEQVLAISTEEDAQWLLLHFIRARDHLIGIRVFSVLRGNVLCFLYPNTVLGRKMGRTKAVSR